MSIQSAELPARLSRENATLILTDMLRATSVVREIDDETRVVLFFDGYYTLCSEHVRANGGEVIKYLGDACLARFGDGEVGSAIASLLAIREAFADYCRANDVTPTDVKGVVHTGEIIVGEFGPEAQRDAMSKATSTLFAMEAPGITLSEQAYRKLPSDERGPWRKHRGNVVYVMK